MLYEKEKAAAATSQRGVAVSKGRENEANGLGKERGDVGGGGGEGARE